MRLSLCEFVKFRSVFVWLLIHICGIRTCDRMHVRLTVDPSVHRADRSSMKRFGIGHFSRIFVISAAGQSRMTATNRHPPHTRSPSTHPTLSPPGVTLTLVSGHKVSKEQTLTSPFFRRVLNLVNVNIG